MKEVREERFTKKEDVGFNPTPIPKAPALQGREGESGERSNERTNAVRVPEARSTDTAYIVAIPSTRRKTRQSFDIFEDQYDALKKLQLAEADQAEDKHGRNRKLGDMVQEALDAFIKEKARKLGTISIRREHERP
jgi:hypothetical protein